MNDESNLPKHPKDMLVRLPSGADGVRVTFRFLPRLLEGTRADRKRILHTRFEETARQVESIGARVDLDHCSLAGQTCTAIVPLDSLEELRDQLRARDIAVDLLEDKQVVDP